MTKVEILKLSPRDVEKFIQLIKVFEQVFEMKNFNMPDKKYLQQLLDNPDFFVFTALEDNAVVGGLTCYILHQYYSKSPLVYIYDLAVITPRQRQGIGKLLISRTKSYCKQIGIEEIFVQADRVDDHAIKFYRSTSPVEEDVIHFSYPLMKI